MELLGKSSKFVSKILDYVVATIIIIILLFSSYSLYTSLMLFNGAYISDTLLSLKPGTVDAASGEPATFDDLMGINSDVKAWVTVKNTHIDYPVVQGKSNLEYINKNIYNEFAFEGAIFLDSRNDKSFSDKYNLLYGHHMDNGGMFGDLELFLEKGFFERNRVGSLITKDVEYDIDFFAVVQADGYDANVFNPIRVETEEDKYEFLEYIESFKVHSRDVDIAGGEKIIALSTCTSTQTNGRTILYGVLRPR